MKTTIPTHPPVVDLRATLAALLDAGAQDLQESLDQMDLNFEAARLATDYARFANGWRRALAARQWRPEPSGAAREALQDFLRQQVSGYVDLLVREADQLRWEVQTNASQRLAAWVAARAKPTRTPTLEQQLEAQLGAAHGTFRTAPTSDVDEFGRQLYALYAPPPTDDTTRAERARAAAQARRAEQLAAQRLNQELADQFEDS